MDCFSVMMEHVCDVYRPTTSRDSGGGTAVSWAVRTSGVKYLLNVSPASESDRFDQPNLIGAVTGATFDTTVQRGDKLLVTAGPTLVGVSLHVTGIKSQPGVESLGFDAIVHITAERVV